ncbi:MAG: hypothetical protein L6U99_03650 [Clostridium sp.]|nr:MAG: hypothetical protein L6U99_03650 [Clostridium sp.]
MLHAKCKTSVKDIINAAKASIGNDNEYLSFFFTSSYKKTLKIHSIQDR